MTGDTGQHGRCCQLCCLLWTGDSRRRLVSPWARVGQTADTAGLPSHQAHRHTAHLTRTLSTHTRPCHGEIVLVNLQTRPCQHTPGLVTGKLYLSTYRPDLVNIQTGLVNIQTRPCQHTPEHVKVKSDLSTYRSDIVYIYLVNQQTRVYQHTNQTLSTHRPDLVNMKSISMKYDSYTDPIAWRILINIAHRPDLSK